MFAARVNKRQLAGLCRRLATSLEAGLDIRRIMSREAEGRASGALRSRLAEVDQQVARGVSLQEAVDSTGDFFPPMFREMLGVGEATGKQAEVFRRMADHFDHQLLMRRMFLIALAWPGFQLVLSILVIGAMIFALGLIAQYNNGKAVDILGGGLVGTPGLIKYFGFIGFLCFCGFMIYVAIRQGWLWGRIIERIMMHIPVVGGVLRSLAMERLAWSLNLTMDTPMPTTKAVELSLRSTQNSVYQDVAPDIVRDVKSGRSITEGFERARVFPSDFLEALEIGERAGRIPESMQHLSQQYQDKGRIAIRALTAIGTVVTIAFIGAIIIAFIFRIAFFYVGTINDAANMRP